VLIIGAGPAGICAAMALANLGAKVTVCEMRPEETFMGTSKRSYVIILQDRGLDALEAAGFQQLKNPDSRRAHLSD
jgi:2-polyprenyl-6-methoxyphenol hydroxylase-like FAD-dependent oxidoreductase